MSKKVSVAILAACALLSACTKKEAEPTAAAAQLTDAEAAKIADAAVSVWASMDAAKVKALYSPDIVAFDYAVPGLSTDRALFDKRQDAFVAFKMDKFVEKERKIQILGPDTFVMSGTWDGTSSSTPANNGPTRCTDVFQKQGDGTWLIANEHCSAVPKG